MCKRSARLNGEMCEEIDMRSMHAGTDECIGLLHQGRKTSISPLYSRDHTHLYVGEYMISYVRSKNLLSYHSTLVISLPTCISCLDGKTTVWQSRDIAPHRSVSSLYCSCMRYRCAAAALRCKLPLLRASAPAPRYVNRPPDQARQLVSELCADRRLSLTATRGCIGSASAALVAPCHSTMAPKDEPQVPFQLQLAMMTRLTSSASFAHAEA